MTSAQAAGRPWPEPREFKRAAREALKAVAEAWEQGGHHHHHHHRGGGPHEERQRGRRGFPPEFGRGPWGWGPGGPGPFGHRGRWGGRGGRKAKRGDVRAAILALLSEEPRNGYQIIQEIAERSEGGWKPSPGAVYPALQQLTDEGLVVAEENEGRKTFRLTETGLRLHRGARRRDPRPVGRDAPRHRRQHRGLVGHRAPVGIRDDAGFADRERRTNPRRRILQGLAKTTAVRLTSATRQRRDCSGRYGSRLACIRTR